MKPGGLACEFPAHRTSPSPFPMPTRCRRVDRLVGGRRCLAPGQGEESVRSDAGPRRSSDVVRSGQRCVLSRRGWPRPRDVCGRAATLFPPHRPIDQEIGQQARQRRPFPRRLPVCPRSPTCRLHCLSKTVFVRSSRSTFYAPAGCARPPVAVWASIPGSRPTSSGSKPTPPGRSALVVLFAPIASTTRSTPLSVMASGVASQAGNGPRWPIGAGRRGDPTLAGAPAPLGAETRTRCEAVWF